MKNQTKNQPFTHNAPKKIEKMAEAANHIYAAIKALEQAQRHAENWADYESLQDDINALKRFLSCDNGEAGFQVNLERQAAEHKRWLNGK
jgi:hypothetical protein